MSTWLCKQIRVGDSVTIRGPYGDCRYRGETREQNLLMIATGSGLAPVYGIAIDALTAQHRGQIHLYHGSRSEEGLYLQGKLEELSERHQNFHYTPTCSGPSSKVRHGRANDLAFADHPNLANWHVYLCGHPGMVSKSAMRAYLSGAQICDIYADPFEPASKPT